MGQKGQKRVCVFKSGLRHLRNSHMPCTQHWQPLGSARIGCSCTQSARSGFELSLQASLIWPAVVTRRCRKRSTFDLKSLVLELLYYYGRHPVSTRETRCSSFTICLPNVTSQAITSTRRRSYREIYTPSPLSTSPDQSPTSPSSNYPSKAPSPASPPPQAAPPWPPPYP